MAEDHTPGGCVMETNMAGDVIIQTVLRLN